MVGMTTQDSLLQMSYGFNALDDGAGIGIAEDMIFNFPGRLVYNRSNDWDCLRLLPVPFPAVLGCSLQYRVSEVSRLSLQSQVGIN